MTRLLGRIRWRLVGWTMLVVGLILLLSGTAVYLTLARGLYEQVDRNLLSRSEQAMPPPPPSTADRPQPAPPDRLFRGREGFRGGVFYVAFGPDGQVMANPQQVQLDSAALPAPPTRAPEFATVELGEESTRLVVRRMPDGGRLVVGQSLAPTEAALRSLLLTLLGGSGVGFLLAFGGAWFLAGRALVPIQQAFQRQQEFVADASHELRTPLTVLQSSTDVLDRYRDRPLAANAELWNDVREEIARMVRLTSDLLTLARTDRGELQLLTAPLDLTDLAGDVLRRVRPLAEHKGVQLELVAEGPAPTVEADPDRLQQVLLIVLDNALKHTPATGRVEVRVSTQGAHGVLEVADTGEGIAPEHLGRIFDRFYRANAARSRAPGEGTGLGLAIAKVLVEAHGGAIDLSSTAGAGTRVTIRLPLEGQTPSLGERLGSLTARLTHTPAQH